MTNRETAGRAPRVFPQTRWSLVMAATQRTSPESAAAALDSLCSAYWLPLYAYVRKTGRSPHDAQDLTQEFFRRLLENRWLEDADPDRGKLRTFLVVALKHFMNKEWRRASAQRRGGGQPHVQFDTAFAESRCAADTTSLAAEETFDRQWALALLDMTVNRLREEFVAADRARDFESLKHCLMAERGAIDYAAVAEKLGVNEGAARVAVHRLRKRFREVYREEISQTLTPEANLNEELRHLAAALARR